MLKPGTDLGNMITGQMWKDMMIAGAQALGAKKREVDALNVFPVPDGDTGTNMHLTIQSAAKEAAKVPGEALADVATAASMGSLMGARGNSGVILSQLMRGIAKGLEGLSTANAQQIAQALQTGVDTAYKAVMKPVEGTILTVAKEAARGALNKAKLGAAPLDTLKEAYQKGQAALIRTPELLHVLKQAGVVDAGGKGFLVILGGWIRVIEGLSLEDGESLDGYQQEGVAEPSQGGFFPIENLEYPYCTEFLVKGEQIPLEQIKTDISGWGDSMLVVGTPEVVKIHIHTKNPGQVLEYAIQWGALHEVAIHNMLAQNEAMAHALKGETPEAGSEATDTEQLAKAPEITKEYGVVAVVMGEGIARVFTSLGADQVVFGGQTMNPSTEDLVEAARKTAARNIYILPNNANIILAAQQVQEILKDRNVYAIPSKSIPQGISALLNFLPDEGIEKNLRTMEGALSRVGSGEVTYAVRDSQYDGFSIEEGDILGLVEDKLTVTGKERLDVAKETLEHMNWRDYDLVTIFLGQDVVPEEAKTLEEWLHAENRDVEVEVYPGGQPLYYYILGVE